MARTKKVGITGRFGARYGRKAKRSVKSVEESMASTIKLEAEGRFDGTKGLVEDRINEEGIISVESLKKRV